MNTECQYNTQRALYIRCVFTSHIACVCFTIKKIDPENKQNSKKTKQTKEALTCDGQGLWTQESFLIALYRSSLFPVMMQTTSCTLGWKKQGKEEKIKQNKKPHEIQSVREALSRVQKSTTRLNDWNTKICLMMKRFVRYSWDHPINYAVLMWGIRMHYMPKSLCTPDDQAATVTLVSLSATTSCFFFFASLTPRERKTERGWWWNDCS